MSLDTSQDCPERVANRTKCKTYHRVVFKNVLKMLVEELKNIIKGEISSDAKELSVYSRDASIFEVRPSVVVHPKNTEDIKSLVKWVVNSKASNEELSLTA